MQLTFLSLHLGQHRQQKVIWCAFEYNPAHLAAFKQAFPSARWSQTQKSWYVTDSSLYRKRLGLETPEIGHRFESRIAEVNRSAFVQFRNALQQRAYAPATVKTYLTEFAQLLLALGGQDVNEVEAAQLNAWFLHQIKKQKCSENQVNSRINAVKSYFKLVLNKAFVFDQVPRPRSRESLPKVLSKAEIKRLFEAVQNPKHQLMLKLCYGMGLRVSEIVNLKVSDIDSGRMQVRIEQAKGKKDRCVNLPESVLPELRLYYKEIRPKNYLFEGQFGGQYTVRSVQATFKRAMEKAKINKKVGVHGLRHSYATHLLEAGTDMVFIQKLLGHKHIQTTEVYAKVTNKILGNVQSPLDSL